MAEAVVDRFEIVDIEEHDRDESIAPFRAGDGLVDAVLKERAIRQTGQRVVKGKVREIVLEPLLFSDVAETPHPPDDGARDELRLRMAMKDATVDEFKGVRALRVGLRVELIDSGGKGVGIDELIGDVFNETNVIPRGDQASRQFPHLRELTVEAGDLSVRAHDQYSVSGRLKGRVKQGKCLSQFTKGILQLHFGRYSL